VQHPSKLTSSSRRKRLSSSVHLANPLELTRFRAPFDSPWLLASLAANAVFMTVWGIGIIRDRLFVDRDAPTTVVEYVEDSDDRQRMDSRNMAIARGAPASQRHFSYQDWLDILQREATEIAESQPSRLYVLAGDSISQWFPKALLPPQATWLNQSISGEGSKGLYDRLTFLDDTKPEKIFVMIGINDLIRGMDDDTLLEQQRRIIKDILWIHPDVEVVVQSILPHGDQNTTWEGKAKLERVSNDRIRSLNERLAAIAEYEGATFLDLFDLFETESGQLRPELSTDGLHLNEQGYLVWRTALMVFDEQHQAKSDEPEDTAIDSLIPDAEDVAWNLREDD
jgi:lysophospholipase L1-like esterase